MRTDEIQLTECKNIIIVESGMQNQGWTLAYNPDGVEALQGVHRYLAEWLIRFIPILRKHITIYQMLSIIESELEIYFITNTGDKKQCLTMEIYNDRKFDKEPRVVLSIPEREFNNKQGRIFRKSPLYLYSPSPVKAGHEINRVNDFDDMVNPIERLLTHVAEYDRKKIKAYEKITV